MGLTQLWGQLASIHFCYYLPIFKLGVLVEVTFLMKSAVVCVIIYIGIVTNVR
jgi:hypothetical protein